MKENLIKEFNELNEKITDLRNSITSDTNPINQDLAIAQLNAMETYISILSIRIGLINE